MQHTTAKGRLLWVRAMGSAHFEGDKAVRLSGMFQDIDERKKLETDLRRANTEKSHFLARMSHEIRTPLNAVIGLGELALRTELTPKQQDYLQKLHSSAKLLLHLINDILDFSKIEAGKLVLEQKEFSLRDTLDQIADVIALTARSKDIELSFCVEPNMPDQFVGDALRLKQICINLINNAVKFTEKGFVLLSIRPLEMNRTTATLEFSIRDSGIGISEEQQQRLFSAFFSGRRIHDPQIRGDWTGAGHLQASGGAYGWIHTREKHSRQRQRICFQRQLRASGNSGFPAAAPA